MNDDKSPIDSFSVSLGKSAGGRRALSGKQLEPWDLLICSDLGFTSTEMQSVKISEWNEFMAAQHIVISGTVENMLQPGAGAIYIDYSIAAMKDFSSEALQLNIDVFSGYAGILDALTRVLDGQCGKEEALFALKKAPIAETERARVMRLFGLASQPRQPKDEPTKKKSALSSILSMVDVQAGPEDANPAPHSALDGLLSTLSAGTCPVADKQLCTAYIEAGKKTLARQVDQFCSQPFFSRRKAAWQCLFQCAKAVGRKKEIRLCIVSSPMEEVDTLLEKLPSELVSPESSPDIILWDFPVSFTNADIDRMTLLLEASDRWKSIVITSLAQHDPIFADLDKKEDFAPIFQDVRFLQYKKLRSSISSRALCICGPDMTLPFGASAKDSMEIVFPARCLWPVIMRWLDRADDPFALEAAPAPLETSLPMNAEFRIGISKTICQEAATFAGLTLFDGSPMNALIDRAKSVIDPEVAGSAYASLPFNLMVNRVARLAAKKIGNFAGALSREELSTVIQAFLAGELAAYGICTSHDQVSVKPEEDQTLLLTLNSDVKVGGYPAQVSFTLDI
jgi:hypothetical protein